MIPYKTSLTTWGAIALALPTLLSVSRIHAQTIPATGGVVAASVIGSFLGDDDEYRDALRDYQRNRAKAERELREDLRDADRRFYRRYYRRPGVPPVPYGPVYRRRYVVPAPLVPAPYPGFRPISPYGYDNPYGPAPYPGGGLNLRLGPLGGMRIFW